MRTHWTKYGEGCERTGRVAEAANWRVAKTVFVAKDDVTAKAYAMDPAVPYHYYYNTLFKKLKRRGALGVFKSDPQMPDDQVTLEGVMEQLVIHDSDGREGCPPRRPLSRRSPTTQDRAAHRADHCRAGWH